LGLERIREARGDAIDLLLGPGTESFFMLFAYPKSMKDGLSTEQLRMLSRIVKEEFS
jgi:hypothetical protein